MNNPYHDIRSRIDAEPRWWDEMAVPRYCEPKPTWVSNIYAREVAFVRIECQACGREFLVCFSGPKDSLSKHVGELHYGDPPNVGCCMTGPTMNSIPIEVVAFWQRGYDQGRREWERVSEYEVEIIPPWAS